MRGSHSAAVLTTIDATHLSISAFLCYRRPLTEWQEAALTVTPTRVPWALGGGQLAELCVSLQEAPQQPLARPPLILTKVVLGKRLLTHSIPTGNVS